MSGHPFIACGMYAFSDDLQRAWQQLFARVVATLAEQSIDPALVFESGAVMRHPELFLGHTCGYPLMTHLKNRLTPICVPLFEVPGCRGKHYSSRLIVADDAAIDTLGDCRDGVVALNSADSNSGMNLLRHALAGAGARGTFFRRVLLTGGHGASLEAVAQRRAQLAAIDCVTYQLISERAPESVARVRDLGFTVQSCGLPFAAPRGKLSPAAAGRVIDALNRAVADAGEAAATLHLTGFEPVTWEDYYAILELENLAVDAGYAELK